MSSPAAAIAGDGLPAPPPPIRTAPARAGEEQEALPATPTSEESKLRPPAECPPAPRKPRRLLGKRKAPDADDGGGAPRPFAAVPRDLAAVFRALPPKKRIRAGAKMDSDSEDKDIWEKLIKRDGGEKGSHLDRCNSF